MARFKNVSPLGALELPLIGAVIAAGEEFDIDPEYAPLLAGQDQAFAPVDAAAKELPSPLPPTEGTESPQPQPEPAPPETPHPDPAPQDTGPEPEPAPADTAGIEVKTTERKSR